MSRSILLAFIFVFTSVLAFSQAKKYIFMEHFTNSKCSSCGASNPGYYATIANYEGNYHHLSIHPSFPYTSCALYQANTTENTLRTSFYSINSTPSVMIGGLTKKSASGVTKAILNAELGKLSPIQVKVTENSGMSRTAQVEVKSLGTIPAGNYRIFVAAAEKVLNYASSNGEKVHYDVFRKFISAPDGNMITLANTGSSINLDFNYAVSSSWVESQTYVLVWIQNITTKEILNSGSRYDVTTNTQDLSVGTFKIYPNPVKDQVNVAFENQIPVSYSAVITNIFGRSIKSSSIKSGSSNYSIPVNELPRGVYFLRLSSGNKSVTKKWFKD